MRWERGGQHKEGRFKIKETNPFVFVCPDV